MAIFNFAPPSNSSTVMVDSYYPTSNWMDGKWVYQDLSYMLHNPELSLPIAPPVRKRGRKVYHSASGRVAGGSIPVATPSFVKPVQVDSGSEQKDEKKSYVIWYVAGGLLLVGVGVFFAVKAKSKPKQLMK